MLTAVAYQETGYIWSALCLKGLPTGRILELCVGDTLDEDRGRRAFPRTYEELIASPDGPQLFAVARRALEEVAEHVPDYLPASKKPHKFVHGFGIFQYDLQFCRTDKNFFLSRLYMDFGECLKRVLKELRLAMERIGWGGRTALGDYDFACVAIAYNTGSYKPERGLKQGSSSGGRYYGEAIYDYLRLIRSFDQPIVAARPPGRALVREPTPVTAAGPRFRVDTTSGTLRLRSGPQRDPADLTANVIGDLPDGHEVRAVTGVPVDGFLEVETSLRGAFLRGFAAMAFLEPVQDGQPLPAPAPVIDLPRADLPRKPGQVTRRADKAGALSLNEPDQPGRTGDTPADLCRSLIRIVAWLAVDDSKHLRYQPADGSTYCNIYAHDYCHLAGVYLPRVWWTQKALMALAQGMAVSPRYADTVDEQRANDLFRWLRDFGPQFGWRQTGTLTKLQTEVNQGAVGLIVARRKEDGKSGHIVAVVPETESHQAIRNAGGEVTSALQSQAGDRNFRLGTGTPDWFKGERFAESAFWIHS
ncbi:hypothetical protein [Azospirillum thermophilum]|nr:hypothetical protein [Azospirillum thermophilum]